MSTQADMIVQLQQTIKTQAALIQQQADTIAKLEERVGELELKLLKARKNSSNSSLAPSSDITKPPKPNNSNTEKGGNAQQGSQTGHDRHLREMLPPERVDEQIIHELAPHQIQEQGLVPTDEFETIQHIELLDFPLFVTEHKLRKYRTASGKTVVPHLQEIQGQPIFGPRLLATIGWFKSNAHCSYSTIEAWMEDVLQIPVSRGYLAKLCNGVISQSLAEAHQELKKAIPDQTLLGSDETSFKNNGKKHWVWCITAGVFSFFSLATNRSRENLEELIGSGYDGILHCDYYSSNTSFAWNFHVKAQYCWAHLIRDIRFLLKHPDLSTRQWAERLLDRTRTIFSVWHARDQLSEEEYRRLMLSHRSLFLFVMRKIPDSSEAWALASRFEIVGIEGGFDYDMSIDYFRFLFEAGVEPTNNHSEQQIRQCVIDRKITQGTRSEAGQRYHERMWTAIATCRQQKRSFFGFLLQSITAKLDGSQFPSLLPN